MNQEKYLWHIRLIQRRYEDFVCAPAFDYCEGMPVIWPGWISTIHTTLRWLSDIPDISNGAMKVYFSPALRSGRLVLDERSALRAAKKEGEARTEAFIENLERASAHIDAANSLLERTCIICGNDVQVDGDVSESPCCEKHALLDIENLDEDELWEAVESGDMYSLHRESQDAINQLEALQLAAKTGNKPMTSYLQDQVGRILACCDEVEREYASRDDNDMPAWTTAMGIDQPLRGMPRIPGHEVIAEAMQCVCKTDAQGWKKEYVRVVHSLERAWMLGVDTLPQVLAATAERFRSALGIRSAIFMTMLVAEQTAGLDLQPVSNALYRLLHMRDENRISLGGLADSIGQQVVVPLLGQNTMNISTDKEPRAGGEHENHY